MRCSLAPSMRQWDRRHQTLARKVWSNQAGEQAMRVHQNLMFRRSIKMIVAINIVSDLLFDADRAHAQSAEAEKLFDDGNRLEAAGKLVEACAAFEASNRAEPRAGTLIRLGGCHEKNQQLASAWSAYKDARRLATDPRKRELATTKITALEPRLSYLVVAVSEQVRVSGLELIRNGKLFDPTLWNNELPIDRGDYSITGRAPGYKTWQRTVHVPVERARLSVIVPALIKADSIAVPQAPLPQRPSEPLAGSPTPS